jgi:adenylate cyclase
MNKLLARLLRKHLNVSFSKEVPTSLNKFIMSCDSAFEDLTIQQSRAQHALSLVSEELLEKNEEIKNNKEKIEKLLFNILPESIIKRVLNNESNIADFIPCANVMFADITNFTKISNKIGVSKTVQFLNDIFTVFDEISKKYQIKKIKIIGDCYMAVSGIKAEQHNHTDAIIYASRDMIINFSKIIVNYDIHSKLRIGINSGPIIAGIIGRSIFNYDIWGDTVNMASRMESSGSGNTIQITKKTYSLLSQETKKLFKPRGYIDVKGSRKIYTYTQKVRVGEMGEVK